MLPEINLLPKKEGKSKALYNIFLIGLIVCIVLYSLFTYMYVQTKDELNTVTKQYSSLEMQKTALDQRLNQSSEDESDMLGNAIAYVEQYHIPTSKFIDQLNSTLPEHGYLSKYDYDFKTASIQTQFETMQDASSYMDKLSTSHFVKEAKIDQLEVFDLDETNAEKVNYELIPRYDVQYSLDVDQNTLKREEKVNE